LWREYRKQVQAANARRLGEGVSDIASLPDAGYTVRKLSDYQFRVNEQVDLFPTHRKYHVLKTGKRGSYGGETPAQLLARVL
jgi:hypothetical protein